MLKTYKQYKDKIISKNINKSMMNKIKINMINFILGYQIN